jgi:hypothetical protein
MNMRFILNQSFLLSLLLSAMPAVMAVEALPGEWQTFGGVSAGCNGTVYETTRGADGTIYLVGDFTVCGDVAANNVVSYDPTTNQFLSLGVGVNGAVFDAVAVGNELYVGGTFSEAGGQGASHLAHWDGSQWAAMGDFNGGVRSLLWQDGVLYAGGFFTGIGALSANRIARWDGAEWSALGVGVDNGVTALAWWSGRLYVGGLFTQAGGAPASRIASWAPGDWQVLPGSTAEGIDHPFFSVVFALVAVDDGVFVGGQFDWAGGEEANSVAFFNGSGWSSLTSNGVNGFASGNVWDMHEAGGEIYFAGSFSSAGGQALNHVARWDGSSWHPIGAGALNGVDSFTETVLVADGVVYTGGDRVHRAGSRAVSHVARWTGADWLQMGPEDQLGIGGAVDAVLHHDGDLYVAGNFGLAGTTPARHIARWDGSSWHPLGNEALSGPVYALAVWNGDLVAVGGFVRVGIRSTRFVARWDGNQWQPLGAGFNASPETVMAADGELCVAGASWLESDSVPINGAACWDGNVWQPLGAGVNGDVLAMAVWNGQLVAAGNFTEAGGQAASRIASWDGSEWSPLGSPPNDGLDRSVYALLPDEEVLQVGGDFFNMAGTPNLYLARWDGTAWSNPIDEPNSTVHALARSPLGLVAGGRFRNVFTASGSEPLERVGLWDGNEWRALGSGVSGAVRSLDARAAEITVGGEFAEADGLLSSGIAIFRIRDGVFSDRFAQ